MRLYGKEFTMRIILASASPRRKQLLAELYSDFEIITANADETLPEGVAIEEAVSILARRKGEAVLAASEDGSLGEALIISADTMVEVDGIPLGKPRDRQEAFEMLSSLSGREHRVHTGTAVSYRGRCKRGTATTRVFFKALTPARINAYIDTGEPFDKAGAYGIQGEAGKFVEKTEGDFDTVVGLSLRLTASLIKEITEESGI